MSPRPKQSIPLLVHITLDILCIFAFVLFVGAATISTQETILLLTITVHLFCLIKTKNIGLAAGITVLVSQVLLLVFWGNSIPYIHLITVVPFYLLVNAGFPAVANRYLFGLLLVTVLEILNVLPLERNEEIELGPYNLFVIFLLQLLSYKILHTFETLFSTISRVKTLGLQELLESTSLNFLQSTIANGLYISVIFHMINNLLQKMALGLIPKRIEYGIISLLGKSDRLPENKQIPLSQIVRLAGLKPTRSVRNVNLPVNLGKLIFIILWNTRMNYDKYEYTCSMNYNSGVINFVFTHCGSESAARKSHIFGRNLGNMKQLLHLLNVGDIKIYGSDSIQTRISFFMPTTPPTIPPNNR